MGGRERYRQYLIVMPEIPFPAKATTAAAGAPFNSCRRCFWKGKSPVAISL